MWGRPVSHRLEIDIGRDVELVIKLDGLECVEGVDVDVITSVCPQPSKMFSRLGELCVCMPCIGSNISTLFLNE